MVTHRHNLRLLVSFLQIYMYTKDLSVLCSKMRVIESVPSSVVIMI